MLASGRNRAIDRTVKPDPEIHSTFWTPSSCVARQAAMVMASVTEVLSDRSVIRISARRRAQPG